MWMWMGLAWGADCATPTAVEDLEASLERAETAVVDLEPEKLQAEVVQLNSEVVPCLQGRVSPEQAARLHRTMAVHLFALDQVDAANDATWAAKRLDPDNPWGEDLLATEHPLRAVWDAAPEDPGSKKVPEPRAGFITFDGFTERRRPKGVPSLVQRFDEGGASTWTGYVGPRESLPAYDEVPRRRNALLGCSLGSAVVGAGMWGAAVASRNGLVKRAQDPETDASVLDRGRARSNVMQAVSWGAFGVSVACGAGAVVDTAL